MFRNRDYTEARDRAFAELDAVIEKIKEHTLLQNLQSEVSIAAAEPEVSSPVENASVAAAVSTEA